MLKFQVRNNERIYQNYTSNILQYMRIYLKYSNYVIASGGGLAVRHLGQFTHDVQQLKGL